MLPYFGGNDCRNLSASTENEHSCKNIMKFYGLFLPIKRCQSRSCGSCTMIEKKNEKQVYSVTVFFIATRQVVNRWRH